MGIKVHSTKFIKLSLKNAIRLHIIYSEKLLLLDTQTHTPKKDKKLKKKNFLKLHLTCFTSGITTMKGKDIIIQECKAFISNITLSGMQYIFLNLLQLPMYLHKRSYDLQQQLPPGILQKTSTLGVKTQTISKHPVLQRIIMQKLIPLHQGDKQLQLLLQSTLPPVKKNNN